METATAGPSASIENVDDLIALVNQYVASGDITGQAENGLLAKLETINKKLMNGELDAAANEMGAFVHEVQAQTGKKINETASAALIAKAEEMAAALVAVVPVTGARATAAPTTTHPIDPNMGKLSQPTPMGTLVDHQTQWDAFAAQIVKAVGLNNFTYELYQLPAQTSWEDILAYYTTEAATAGWGDAPSETNEMSGGNYAVWSVTGSDGTVHYFIVARGDATDNTLTLNIFGSK
jgi:hypothetical protein